MKATYINHLPPCNEACPAGEDTQSWLAYVKEREYREAWEALVQNNPMPAIHGRVCYHPCESACNRTKFDTPININAVEKFLGDMALAENWQLKGGAPATGKKVLVVGAGPAGLSAAYHLRLLGHDVTIFEALPIAGGMMHVGIPSYRLPSDVLAGEIKHIIDMGIKLELNHKVTDIMQEKEQGKFDAIFLGVGSHLDKWAELPGQNHCPIIGAVEFLRANKFGTKLDLGSSLAVYGGGNTAIDVARVARRLGVKDVTIVYRRDRKHMPAFDFEVNETLDEGIVFKFLRTIKQVDGKNMTLEVMQMDDKGKPQPTGQTEPFSADMIVMALGQSCETDFLQKVPEIVFKYDCIEVNEQMMTGKEGIFAGGDMIPYNRSVTFATGHGKKAARCIDAYLRKTTYAKVRGEAASYDALNIAGHVPKKRRINRPLLAPEVRVKDFSEAVGAFSGEEAVSEARRCFSCGNCFECDVCYTICPVSAISKLKPGRRYTRDVESYYIDKDTCVGCEACYHGCPCGAIKMVEE